MKGIKGHCYGVRKPSRQIQDAARSLEAFPMLELADGTTPQAYTSPLFPSGRPVA